MDAGGIGFLVGGAALALCALTGSLWFRRRQRLLHDLPTSKAQGVFIGLVEIKGTAECESPLTSHLASASCVHFAFTVQEHWSRTVTETYTDKDGKSHTRTRQESGWTTLDEGADLIDFYIKDETGVVRVRPDGAKIEPSVLFDQTVGRGDPLYYAKGPAGAVANSDHRRRFVESGIPLHTDLYIVGQARERDDVVAPEIAADKEAPLFLISTRAEDKVQRGYAAWSWVLWSLGLIVAAAGVVLAMRQGNAPVTFESTIRPVLIAIWAYLTVWAFGWIWMVFNSLIGLRNRVRQGWSLIDVQLKRRHDLIPNLASAVQGLAGHERETQETLAALRTQQTATPPGAAGPDFSGIAGGLRAVVEKYPALVAQKEFTRLHDQLVETEQRIALARTYYNDIATEFATRIAQVPDCWIAGLAGMKAEPLLAASNFERAPVNVRFA